MLNRRKDAYIYRQEVWQLLIALQLANRDAKTV